MWKERSADAGDERERLSARYRQVRAATNRFCEPLEVEDYVLQTMADVSPPKWHLAHTTWFFETFVLEQLGPGRSTYEPCHPAYRMLFNSYYETVGSQHARCERGFLSRPTVAEIREYRATVDGRMLKLLASADGSDWGEISRRVVLGLHHEQQHQELLLMDTKYNFSRNPLEPAYRSPAAAESQPAASAGADGEPERWIDFPGGIHEFGHTGPGFVFDNESPRHRALLHPFRIARALVSNGEYLEMVRDGGYTRPDLWLSDGWAAVQSGGWQAPLYWRQKDGEWYDFTLRGSKPLDLDEPVAHVSYYEADAFARWAGKRLPTEHEWELLASDVPVAGNFVESQHFHPAPAEPGPGPAQVFGDVWEWTQSPYVSYPGYRPLPGALGEYNGKFMCSQQVLRGGSCLTSQSHIRATYRNFFYPHQRWNTQGLRLAQDLR